MMGPENNGAGGAIDFTNGASPAGGGLSMADSLASAQDSLTSAGLAAKDNSAAAMGLDQISSSDPSATMARPDEPLIPAAPVPGSLGSVTSGPAVMPSLPEVPATPAQPVEVAPLGVVTDVPAAPVPAPEAPAMMANTAAPQAPTNPFTPVDPAVANPSAAAPAPAPEASAANPFAGKTSSSNIPTGLKPKIERFSKSGDGKKPNLTVILGAVAGLMAVLAIVFCILWLTAKDKEKIVYVNQIPQPEVAANDVGLKCTQTMAAETISTENGMTGGQVVATLGFVNGELGEMNNISSFYFVDNSWAEAMRPSFEQMVSALGIAGGASAGQAVSASYEVADATVNMYTAMNVDILANTPGTNLDLPKDEAGNYLRDVENVRAYLEGKGYACEEIPVNSTAE